MRLTYLLELVFAVGVGCGFARFELDHFPLDHFQKSFIFSMRVETGISGIFMGMSLVEGLGTLAERARGKSPAVWGSGRWVWASLSIFLMVETSRSLTELVVMNCREGRPAFEDVADLFQSWRTDSPFATFETTAPYFLLSVGLVRLAAPRQVRTTPDAREWAGRVYAALFVGYTILAWVLDFTR